VQEHSLRLQQAAHQRGGRTGHGISRFCASDDAEQVDRLDHTLIQQSMGGAPARGRRDDAAQAAPLGIC
jgi:hypothetical protein